MDLAVLITFVLLWIVVLFNLVLTLLLVRRVTQVPARPESRQQSGPVEGEVAPDFRAETLGGEVVTRQTYSGREVALVFLGPHCPACREELPNYIQLWPKAQRAGVELVLVSFGTLEETHQLVHEFNIETPLLIAPKKENSFDRDFNIHETPFFCLLDPDGRLVSKGNPFSQIDPWRTITKTWELRGEAVGVGQELRGGVV